MSCNEDSELSRQVWENTLIIQKCRSYGYLFEDPDFPATDESLKAKEVAGDDIRKSLGNKWLRPKEINENNASFILQGLSRHDVNQGGLGDCWFLASLASLAEHKEVMERLMPDWQSMNVKDGYCGAFRFRLWKFGREVEVLVDDRLPTDGTGPAFTQPLNDEFWVCLLEKALAKLYGSYESLSGGHIHEGLADLTGGLPEVIDVSEHKGQLEKLGRYLEKCISIKGSGVGAASFPLPEKHPEMKPVDGIYYGHAYTVTGLKRIRAQSRNLFLIRLRNPHGRTEWTGDWSDNYSGWTESLKQSVQLQSKNEGEFWMSLEDFTKFFSSISIVHFGSPADPRRHCGEFGTPRNPNQRQRTDWICHEFRGCWRSSETPRGFRDCEDCRTKLQYEVDLKDSPTDEDDLATCLVYLEEPVRREHYRTQASSPYLRKGVVLKSAGGNEVAESWTSPDRSFVRKFQVTPGRYVLEPYTTAPNSDREFLLRVFTER